MATKTFISPLAGIAIAKEDGKTLISPLRGIAIQQPAAAVGDVLMPQIWMSLLPFLVMLDDIPKIPVVEP